jgi:hypothetical protein
VKVKPQWVVTPRKETNIYIYKIFVVPTTFLIISLKVIRVFLGLGWFGFSFLFVGNLLPEYYVLWCWYIDCFYVSVYIYMYIYTYIYTVAF